MATWGCAACGASNWTSRNGCRYCGHHKTYAQALTGGRKAASGDPPWSQRNRQGHGAPVALPRQRDQRAQRARGVPIGVGASDATRRPAAGGQGSSPTLDDHADPNDINVDGAAQPPPWVPQRNLQRKLDRMLRKRSALNDDLESLDAAAQTVRDQIASLEADMEAVRADMAAAVARAASEVPACSAPVAELEGLPASVRNLPAVQAILAEAAGAIRRIAATTAAAETDGYEDDPEDAAMDDAACSPGAIYVTLRTPEARAAARAASQSASGEGVPGSVPTPVPTPGGGEAPETPLGRWNRGVPRVGPLPGGPSGRHGTSPFADYAARRGRDPQSRSRTRSASPDDGQPQRSERARPTRERGQPTLEEWWAGRRG